MSSSAGPSSRNVQPPPDDWAGRRVTVCGLGRFGGGLGAVQWLLAAGACVTVSDQGTAESLRDSLALLPPESTWGPGAELHLAFGHHDPNDLTSSELVVMNPALPYDHPLIRLCEQQGVPLTSEINLFWERNPAPVIGVTGSNGKSTTTTLIAELLAALGHTVWLGGNIGRSLLPEVHLIRSTDWVVLELSSFQLTWLDRLGVSPRMAVVTNFSENHLDWHHSLEHYRWAKQTLLRYQQPGDVAILNADDPEVRAWPTSAAVLHFAVNSQPNVGLVADHAAANQGLSAHWCGPEVEALAGVSQGTRWPVGQWSQLPGAHNLSNLLAALVAVQAASVLSPQPAAATRSNPTEIIERTVRSFRGLPHRLERIGEVAGRRFYNDSKATTPAAAIIALRSFESRIVLLAGGYDKALDLHEFAAIAAQRAALVVPLGQTGPLLAQQVAAAGGHALAPAETFAAAFAAAWQHSQPGDVILLSPGCASFDWFPHYEARGDAFRQLVQQLNSVPNGPSS